MAVSNADVDFPCPPYKIIILDEADSMTQDAQSALRRIMEQYSRITRFCLVCNYVTRIIEPLASRCSKFRFRMLDNNSTQDRLNMIAQAEGVKFEDGVLDTLIKTSDGDLRRAITYLQSAARLHNSSNAERTSITPRSIVEIAGVVPTAVIVELGRAVGLDPPQGLDIEEDAAMEDVLKDVPKASFEAIRRSVKKVAMEGYSGSQLLVQVSGESVNLSKQQPDADFFCFHSSTTTSSNTQI